MKDFNDYDGGFIQTAGTHSVKITDMKTEFAKNGKPMIRIRFANQQGDYIDDRIVLQPNTLFKIAKLTKALGLSKEQRGDVKFDENRLDRDCQIILNYLNRYALNKFINIITGPREYEGKTYQEVKSYLSFTGNKRDYDDIDVKFADDTNYSNQSYDNGDDVPF